MNLEEIFYVKSEHLQLVKPLIQEYFDFDSSMFIDEIKKGIENSNINYISFEDGIANVNYLKTFYENPKLAFTNKDYPFKDIADKYPQYFDFKSKDKETQIEDYKVYLCSSYVQYIYYKEKKGLFQTSILIEALKNETVELLTELYRLNGIDIPITQTSIKIYCEVTAYNSKKPAIYTIKGYTLQDGE